MKNGLPFAALLEIATGERDDCARALAEASDALRNASQRLSLLETHRAGCASDGATPELDGARLRDKRAFLTRLDIAIARQSSDVQICEQRQAQSRSALQDAEMRLKAFGNLKVRADRKHDLVVRKREQNLMDEFAARMRPAR